VAALLKGWVPKTHQGSIPDDYLEYSLDEFTFRPGAVASSSTDWYSKPCKSNPFTYDDIGRVPASQGVSSANH
jgi:hypothetical protein